MKLNEHTRRLLLSPSVRIARSKLFLFIAFFLLFPVLQRLRSSVYIYTAANPHNVLNLLGQGLTKPDRTHVRELELLLLVLHSSRILANLLGHGKLTPFGMQANHNKTYLQILIKTSTIPVRCYGLLLFNKNSL
jgi:hypothetical protein